MADAGRTAPGRVLVVIPTYNEADNIVRIVPEVLAQADGLQVLVVDVGSPDGTAKFVQRMADDDRRIHLLQRPGQMGLGTAYVAGFKFALERGFEFVVEMDADFSHDPKRASNEAQGASNRGGKETMRRVLVAGFVALLLRSAAAAAQTKKRNRGNRSNKAGVQGLNYKAALWAAFHLCRLRRRLLVGD